MELPHRMRIRGTIAWVAWLALHLVTLIGNRNRLSALVNLAYPRRDEAHQRHAQQRGIKDLGLVVLSERAHAFQQRLAEAPEHATRELASRRHSSRSLPFRREVEHTEWLVMVPPLRCPS